MFWILCQKKERKKEEIWQKMNGIKATQNNEVTVDMITELGVKWYYEWL